MSRRIADAPWTPEQLKLAAQVYLDLVDRAHCPGVTKRHEAMREVERIFRVELGLPEDGRKNTPAGRLLETWLASSGRVGVREVKEWFYAQGYESDGETVRYHLRRLELDRKVDWTRGRGPNEGHVRWVGGAA